MEKEGVVNGDVAWQPISNGGERRIGWPGELCGYQAATLDCINRQLFKI